MRAWRSLPICTAEGGVELQRPQALYPWIPMVLNATPSWLDTIAKRIIARYLRIAPPGSDEMPFSSRDGRVKGEGVKSMPQQCCLDFESRWRNRGGSGLHDMTPAGMSRPYDYHTIPYPSATEDRSDDERDPIDFLATVQCDPRVGGLGPAHTPGKSIH